MRPLLLSSLALCALLAACGGESSGEGAGLSSGASGAAASSGGSSGATSSSGDAATSSSSGGAHERFCYTRPRLAFCEDFDENALPGAFAEQAGVGAELVLHETAASSPPRALRITAEGGAIDARLHTARFEPRGKLRSMTMIRLAERAAGEGDEPLRLLSHSFEVDGGSYRYSLATNAKQEWFIEELWQPSDGAASSRRFALSANVPSDQWITARFQIDVAADGTGSLKLLLGLEQVSPTIELATPKGPLASTYSIGLDGHAAAPAWSVEFDSVTFYFE